MTFTQMLTLSEAAPIVIDGGLGSAAEDRGIDLGHALWSAELIRRDPDTLLAVHSAFADAGARILTTASYQATPTGFVEAGISVAEGNRIITDSVRVARSAAERRDVLTAGSVGPYGAALGDGAEYTGDYRLSSSEYTAFHRPRIAALAEAGADLLAIETQPRLDEIAAIIGLTDETGLPSWVTVTLQTGTDTSVPDPARRQHLGGARGGGGRLGECAGDRSQLCAPIPGDSGTERTVAAHGSAAHRLSELG
jgi:homocysteine S-methyltransferase